MRNPILPLAVVLLTSTPPVLSMCIETEAYVITARILSCETPTRQLREGATRIHELEARVAYPNREEFITLVLEKNKNAVILTLQVLDERGVRWRWGRGGRRRDVEEFRSPLAPRVEQLWRWLEGAQTCSDYPANSEVTFAIDSACEDMIPRTSGPSVTGCRIALNAELWVGRTLTPRQTIKP